MRTSINITGTSTSTPTIVASATGKVVPKIANSRLTMHRIRRYLDSCIGNAAGDEHIRETLIKTFIHKIYVYPDKLAIVCFYSEDSRELKFEDMEKLFERKRQEEERLKKQMANTRELKPEVRKVYQKMLESFIMDDDEDTDNGDENPDKSELSDIKKNHADECSHSSGLVDRPVPNPNYSPRQALPFSLRPLRYML